MVYSLWFKDVSIPGFLFYTRDSDILLAGFLEESPGLCNTFPGNSQGSLQGFPPRFSTRIYGLGV